MKKIQINKLNLLLMNFFISIFAYLSGNMSKADDIDITQKGATFKIAKNKQSFYSGIVKMPKCPNSHLELCMCYNGNIIKVKNNDNLFMIKENKKDKFNVLITSPENFSADSQDNTVLYFKLKKNYTYKFFELLKFIKEDSKLSWQIKSDIELPQKNDKTIVPLDTLIIPVDPKNIEIKFEERDTKPNSKVINLPIIKIESEDFCDLEEQINQSCCAIMKIKPFNVTQEKKEILQDNLKVCMVN